MHDILGTLFVGYSGFPLQALQKCSEANCLSQSAFRGRIHYLFPSWFLVKALVLTIIRTSLGEISIALSLRRVVPNGTEIFRLIGLNDVEGIKELFRMRAASPNDSDSVGNTVLMVRGKIFLIQESEDQIPIPSSVSLESFWITRCTPVD